MGLPSQSGDLKRSVLIGTLSNLAGRTLALSVTFVLTPYVLHSIGASDYGLALLVGSVVAYGDLLNFGVGGAIVKYVAEYHAGHKWDQAQALVATAIWIYCGVGLCIVAIGLLLAPAFPIIFRIADNQSTTVFWLVILSCVNFGIGLPLSTASAVLRGLQRFDLVNLVRLVGLAMSALLTVIVLYFGGGVIGMVAVNIPVSILGQWLSVWLVRLAEPQLRIGWAGVDREMLSLLAKFGSGLFLDNVAGQIKTRADEVVIGAFLPVANITSYAIGRRLAEMPQLLADQFIRVVMPLASHVEAGDQRIFLKSLYLTSNRLTLAIAVPLACIVVVLARPFLTLWLGPDFAFITPVVYVLTLANLIDVSLWPIASVAQGMARHRSLALASLSSAFVNLVLSLWLVNYLGVIGVALGTLLPIVFEAICFVIPFGLRMVGVRLRAAFSEIYLPVLIPAAPALAASYGLRMVFSLESWPEFAVIAVTGLCVYFAGYSIATVGKPEHAVLQQAWQTTRRLLRIGA